MPYFAFQNENSGNEIMIGAIVLWYGDPATIPAGWQVCDGSNSTPDLRNVFPIGASSFDTVPKTTVGGSAAATGGTASHTHTLHNNETSSGPINEYVSADIDAYTNGASHLPPYRAVYYIMKVS